SGAYCAFPCGRSNVCWTCVWLPLPPQKFVSGRRLSRRSTWQCAMIDLRRLALALGGETIGPHSVRAPGPRHSPQDRSLSVKITRNGPLVHSFAGDDWRACLDHVRARCGEPSARASVPHGNGRERPTTSNESALRLWGKAVDPARTVVDRYLA